MELNSVQNSQSYAESSLSQKQISNVDNIFKTMLDENRINSDLSEDEFKKLSFEEAKALMQKLKDSGKISNKGLDSNSFAMGNALLYATSLTNDDNFNKSLFETMKTKEYPSVYMSETIHNMEYAEGRRKHPWPTITLEESRGNYSPLSSEEIKRIDIQKYLSIMIKTYENLLSNLPSYYDREETKQSLEDLKDIQKSYEKNHDEKRAVLEQYRRNTREKLV